MAIRKSTEEEFEILGNVEAVLKRCSAALVAGGFSNIVVQESTSTIQANYKKFSVWGEIGITLFALVDSRARVKIKATANYDNVYALFSSPNKKIISAFRDALSEELTAQNGLSGSESLESYGREFRGGTNKNVYRRGEIMKKVLKWIGILFAGLVILGMIVNANKTPEEKAAEAAAREQKQESRSAERVAKEEKDKADNVLKGIPKCTELQTIEGLKKAFDESQFARTLNLSAIEVTNPREVSFDIASKTRMCAGIITMNNTEKANISYALEGRGNGRYMLTFEVKD